VQVKVAGIVVGDHRRDRVLLHQLVEAGDHGGGVLGLRGVEDRPQLALEAAYRADVAVGALRLQPLPSGQVRHQVVAVADRGVDEAR
jgi:hypothetical protein